MLSRSPLAMVLVQVRFPGNLTILGQHDVLDRAMRKAGFPFGNSKTESVLGVDAVGALQRVDQITRKEYENAEGTLVASVGPSFISLFCVDKGGGIPYRGHGEFLDSLSRVIEALEPEIGSVPIARLGYRYVDSISMDDAPDVIADVFLGAYGLAGDEGFGYSIPLSQVDAYLVPREGVSSSAPGIPPMGLHLSCGVAVPGAVVDPAIPVRDEHRWIVDIDSYSNERFPFSSQEVVERASSLADEARKLFFSTIATETFSQRYR